MATQIVADIRDSLGTPLAGYIQIDLDYDLDNGTTSFLSVPARVTLTNGQATFTLEPSELARVSYKFSIYKTASGQPDELVREPFHATVPDSATPIRFVDLVPTGITQAALDGSISAISRRLVADDVFWARFQDELLQLRGAYDPSAWYQRGNLVFFQGGSYVFINRIAATGISPTAGTTNAYWMPTALPGQTVLGAVDPTALAAKADTTYVNAQNALKANLSGAVLTNASVGDTLPLSQNDARIVYAQWVQQLLAPVSARTSPIGSITAYAGTSAPLGWMFCDGRILSRTIYAELFALLGTIYNTGGEVGTVFRLPDLRGRLIACVDQFNSGTAGAAGRIPSLAVGTTGGNANKTLAVSEIPSHSHAINDPGHFHGYQTVATGGSILAGGAGNQPQGIATTSTVTGITISNTGGGAAFSLMNPHIGLNYIIHHGVVA